MKKDVFGRSSRSGAANAASQPAVVENLQMLPDDASSTLTTWYMGFSAFGWEALCHLIWRVCTELTANERVHHLQATICVEKVLSWVGSHKHVSAYLQSVLSKTLSHVGSDSLLPNSQPTQTGLVKCVSESIIRLLLSASC